MVLDEEAIQEEGNRLSVESEMETPGVEEMEIEVLSPVPEESESEVHEETEVPVESESEVHQEAEGEGDSEEERQPLRRSMRRKEKAKVFTYNQVGGKPIIEYR